VSPPFLPPKTVADPEYTLVLDLDETLIHFVNPADNDQSGEDGITKGIANDNDDDFFYMVRPYCARFLTELSEYYEIIIFTAAM